MLERRHSIADWVCSKTQILLATSRTQNQLQVVSCVFLEVEHLFLSFGCARNKLQFRTVPQCLRSFVWMLDCVWMGYLLLIFGTQWLKYHIHTTTMSNPDIQATRKLEQFLIPKPRPNTSKENRRLINSVRWITYPQTHTLLKVSLSCTYIFEDNESVIKMKIKGRSATMRHVSRTHRVVFDWLFDRINLEPKIQIKNVNTKNQFADILTKGSFSRD